MVELGIPKLEKYASSNPLLKERYPTPPSEEENIIIRIALFVSESVMDVYFELLWKLKYWLKVLDNWVINWIDWESRIVKEW